MTAYTSLSRAYTNLIYLGAGDAKTLRQKSEAAALKAYEIDPNSADTNQVMAFLKSNAWEWQETERFYKRSLELNPNYTVSYNGYASLLNSLGHHDEAIALQKRARELDPLSPRITANVAQRYYYARRYDEVRHRANLSIEEETNLRRNLLIVEDNNKMRRMIRSVVADLADYIDECADGDAALSLYKTRQPDFVLMDIQMKNLGGIAATRQIISQFTDAKIIIVTNYEDGYFRESARQAGAVGYVLKKNLLEVRGLLERHDTPENAYSRKP